MLSVQVLVSTMHQKDHSLLKKMNIQTDAIIVNQCDRDEIERFKYMNHDIIWMSFCERGIGLSRNTALLRSCADIILFADEDVTYVDGYSEIIEKAFLEHKKADILTFCLDMPGVERCAKLEHRTHKLTLFNSLRYGAPRIACRRTAIEKARLSFSTLFGGGAKYSSGEDNLFITDAIKKHLCVIATTYKIGVIKQSESTWFSGFNEKLFFDRGVLMRAIFGKFCFPLLLFLTLRYPKMYKEIGIRQALISSFSGAMIN